MSPYEREIRLMPHVAAMERRGVHIDVPSLKRDMDFYFDRMSELDAQVCARLGRQVDVDSNDSLADAIEDSGHSSGFASTPTGRRSTSKDSLLGAVADHDLLGDLLVRGALATCLRTFFQPWHTAAKRTGVLHVKWNQFRNYTDTGARTGRLSSSPNFQNVPTEWEKLLAQLAGIGYSPAFPLPQMRKYIVPAPGHVLLGRDYRSQEMRLLAHFAGGRLLESLRDDPMRDVHQVAADIAHVDRKTAKTVGFTLLYGGGGPRLALALGCPVAKAMAVRAAYLKALPEIKELQRKLSQAASMGQGIETLAGRYYSVQSPSVVKGTLKTFEYKLINYKIQGSAADQTKEAMHTYATTTRNGHLLLTVHDQLVAEVPEGCLEEERAIFKEAMDGSFADVLRCAFPSDEAVSCNFAKLKES